MNDENLPARFLHRRHLLLGAAAALLDRARLAEGIV